MVATVVTVHGIETTHAFLISTNNRLALQQSLSFTVLKLSKLRTSAMRKTHYVATAPTVYGIETSIQEY